VLWVGGEKGMEAGLVQREGIPFQAIPAAGVHGVGLRALPGNLLRLARGFFASLGILRRFKPDVLFFTGGYVAAPLMLASRMPAMGFTRPRSLVYVPDIQPGLALKFISRFADQIAVTVAESRRYFHRHSDVVVTGYPLRQDLLRLRQGREARLQARRDLGLLPDLPVFLVLGGSKGAVSINRALFAALPELLPFMQVVHITGQLDWSQIEKFQQSLPGALSPELSARYHPFPYLHEEMGSALASADLALARAGASTLGELPLFGLPAILVPYPYAWKYQKVNADYLVSRGAALLIQNQDLSDQLIPTVKSLIADPSRLEAMRAAMKQLARPQAARQMADLIHQLVNRTRPTGAQQGT